MKTLYLILLDILVLGILITAIQKKRDADLSVFESKYIAKVKGTALAPLSPEEKLVDSPFTNFADEMFPDLGSRWHELRDEHNKTLQIIHHLEFKRADLLVITTWEGSNIDLHSGEAYLALLHNLIEKHIALIEQHKKILSSMEYYYANNKAQKIIGDSGIQEDIKELMETTDNLLKETSD